jgi:hypothetical protein
MGTQSFDKPLNYELNCAENGYAIVCDGDTAPKAISSGQYLFIKNHSTLATGGYHATTAIANGASLTSSNVAADSDGIANTLNSNLSGNIGTLSNLTTSAKTNTVAAINEVNAKSWTVNQNYSSSTSLEAAVRQAISASTSNGKLYYGTVTWAGHDAGPYLAIGNLALVFFGSSQPTMITNSNSKTL